MEMSASIIRVVSLIESLTIMIFRYKTKDLNSLRRLFTGMTPK